MAIEKWVIVGAKRCDLIKLDVELREQRIYPSNDLLGMPGIDYRVRARACSAAVQCNLANIPCQWAFNSPDNDRF